MLLHIADDVPVLRDDYIIMTREQLNVPGLHMMGHANFQNVGSKLETHFHTNLEFVVVISGRQQYVVGGKRYMLYGNEIFVTYPYEQHGGGNATQDVCEFIWFQIDMSSSQNFLGLSSPRSDYLYRQMLNYRQRTKKANMKDIPLLLKAVELFESKEVLQQTLGYSHFLEFILKNICTPDMELKRDMYSEDIENAISFIHENLFCDLKINVIAEKCGLSPSRFKAKFKEQVGVTPHSYINYLKIDTAKIYLKDSECSITEIAYMLNYSSSNHFASVFKKYTGYTPSEFKEQRFSNMY